MYGWEKLGKKWAPLLVLFLLPRSAGDDDDDGDDTCDDNNRGMGKKVWLI